MRWWTQESDMTEIYKGTENMQRQGSTSNSAMPIHSPLRDAWKQFCNNRPAIFGAAVVLALFFMAAFASYLAPQSPTELNLGKGYTSPSRTHLLGTDEMGRDVLSRIIFGSRIVVMVSLSATASAALMGGAAGLWAGYAGGRLDDLFMRLLDVLMAFPAFLLAITFVAFLGPGTFNIILVVAITRFPRYARLIRGLTLHFKQFSYVEAARAIGAVRMRIVIRHILPQCLGPFLVYTSLTFGGSILAIAGLSFLGLGIQPPTADWGVMLARGRDYMLVAPWLGFVPGTAIFITVLALNLLGEGLRDALDPKLR